MANGAVMEGIEAKLFFTFFGLDAIIKKRMKLLKIIAKKYLVIKIINICKSQLIIIS
jgi:peroxiredoxin family protein